jgi:hypothetical protein
LSGTCASTTSGRTLPVLKGARRRGSTDERPAPRDKVSQRKRKRVEEIFGWLMTVGGMRKTRFIGEAKTQIAAYLSAATYNLLRIAKLQSAGSAA